MIQDNSLVFSANQTVTASAASTNTLDLGATGTPFGSSTALTRNPGKGRRIELAVAVSQTFAGLTALSVSIQTSADNATWVTTTTSQAVPLASLVAGYQFNVPAAFDGDDTGRYVRLYYTVTGTATAGAINAEVVASRQTNLAYGGQ